MKNLLNKAGMEIKKEIETNGFICDSDNVERFLDELALSLSNEEILKGNTDIELYYENEDDIKELSEELLEEIKDKIMCEYNCFYSVEENSDYVAFYYRDDVEFENVEEFNNYFNLGE